jgi:hypothetical protein
MDSTRFLRNLAIAWGVAITLAGCASANKRFEQGAQLEREGRPAEAADRYIQALKKDSHLDSARVGLRNAGAAAIAQYLATANDPSTQAPAAADAYLSVDALQKAALAVGIFLPGPTGYAESRRAAFDKAIARAISDAPLYAAQGQYDQAMSRLQHAATTYEPSAAQAAAMGANGATVMLAWGHAEMSAGNFRSAFGRVDRMSEVPGATQAQIDDARNLQNDAVRRGTRRIAVMPVWATVAAQAQLPDDALPALGDALTETPWINPPPFVAIFPPDQVAQEVRRQGMARRTLASYEAARVARSLGADFAVVAEIDSVSRQDISVRSTRRPVRTTRGADTAFTIEEGTARIYARATYAVIGLDGQQASGYPSTTVSFTAPFSRVRYAGDYRTLDLSRSDRDLFERSRAEVDLARSFASAMSPRLADAVFAEVLRRIP